MKLREKNEVSDLGLPEGFNDETNAFYIPVELREIYSQTEEPSPTKALEKANALLKLEAAKYAAENASYIERKPTAYGREPERVVSVEDGASKYNVFIAENTARIHLHFLPLAIHQMKMSAAITLHKHKLIDDARTKQYAQAHLCPCCNVSDVKNGGEIATRLLANGEPYRGNTEDVITSCLPCWAVAHEIYTKHMANIKVGKLTRVEAVSLVLGMN